MQLYTVTELYEVINYIFKNIILRIQFNYKEAQPEANKNYGKPKMTTRFSYKLIFESSLSRDHYKSKKQIYYYTS